MLLPRVKHGLRLADEPWRKKFAELETYVEEHREIPTTAQNRNLGVWLGEIRNEYRDCQDRSLLDSEKMSFFEAIPGWY